MELVLTEKRGGGYQAHRPTCKKIGDKEQFDPEEITSEALVAVTPCSSCKPKDEDMEAMRQTITDESLVESGDLNAPETVEPAPEPHDEWDDDLDSDEDLIGTPEPAAVKPVPTSAPPKGKPKAAELKSEQASELLNKVANHLSIALPEDLKFPGFGKAVKTEAKQTVYLNSQGTADVRANSAEQAAEWVEGGLGERRGGNYVRINVREL